jgi:hypothetical protein
MAESATTKATHPDEDVTNGAVEVDPRDAGALEEHTGEPGS